MRNVVHLYPSNETDVVALRGVDLDILQGQSVALLGPSGAGKSTVLSLLAGNFVASSGRVEVAGEDIGSMRGDRLAELRAFDVSLVVQDAADNLLPYATAVENLRFARLGGRRRGRTFPHSARDLLDRFGVGELADVPVRKLSPGQWQQVALLAGVASSPRLLLLDEPTSHLGAADRDSVIELILSIGRDLGTTVVLVTHDPLVAHRMDRTVTIRDGRVGAEGRQGAEFTKLGPDGLLQLPADALAVLPAGSLVEVICHEDVVELRRTDLGPRQ
jgi:ABC-type lipoprotein export system ATPase subunit